MEHISKQTRQKQSCNHCENWFSNHSIHPKRVKTNAIKAYDKKKICKPKLLTLNLFIGVVAFDMQATRPLQCHFASKTT